ncbi:MAG: hypothetical protein M5T61_10260 [Acidimicrobiia bacterium]|nr:hypothetical protein [Acidimicrobiia bacterium]
MPALAVITAFLGGAVVIVLITSSTSVDRDRPRRGDRRRRRRDAPGLQGRCCQERSAIGPGGDRRPDGDPRDIATAIRPITETLVGTTR